MSNSTVVNQQVSPKISAILDTLEDLFGDACGNSDIRFGSDTDEKRTEFKAGMAQLRVLLEREYDELKAALYAIALLKVATDDFNFQQYASNALDGIAMIERGALDGS